MRAGHMSLWLVFITIVLGELMGLDFAIIAVGGAVIIILFFIIVEIVRRNSDAWHYCYTNCFTFRLWKGKLLGKSDAAATLTFGGILFFIAGSLWTVYLFIKYS